MIVVSEASILQYLNSHLYILSCIRLPHISLTQKCHVALVIHSFHKRLQNHSNYLRAQLVTYVLISTLSKTLFIFWRNSALQVGIHLGYIWHVYAWSPGLCSWGFWCILDSLVLFLLPISRLQDYLLTSLESTPQRLCTHQSWAGTYVSAVSSSQSLHMAPLDLPDRLTEHS